MLFEPTPLSGVTLLRPQLHEDSRGSFARTWCAQELEAHGLDARLAQCSVSFNHARGTLRGMHYQAEPFPESKLVRCTRGAIFDVALDLRPDSPTFLRWTAATLTAEARNMLFIPAGCAHGFLSLEDSTEVLYMISEFYHPDLARGVRWDDPAFAIAWPFSPAVISDRDRTYPDFAA